MEKPQIITHIQKSMDYTLFDVHWVPRSARLVVLGSRPKGTGALQIYEMAKGDVNLLRNSEKVSSFKCGTFGAANIQTRHLATGDFEGKLCIWDLECVDLPVYCAKGHKEIINCIDGVGGLGIGEGAPEIVTGSRDGTVKVWDPRQKDIPVANMEPMDGEAKRDCWSVAFGGKLASIVWHSHNQQERCVCAGYDNGDIKMFDLRTMALRWETNLKNGICAVEFDRKDIMMNKLVATTLESQFHVFDLRTQHPSKGFSSMKQKAHSSTIWCVSHLPQNRDIWMTTGGNGSLNLWKYSYPAKRKKEDEDKLEVGVMGSVNLLQNVGVSSQPISAFSWNQDKEGLAACTSFDQSLRVMIVTKLKVT